MSRTIGAQFLLALTLFSSAVLANTFGLATPVRLSPGDAAVVKFTLAPNADNELWAFASGNLVKVGNPQVITKLYNGDTLLGTHTLNPSSTMYQAQFTASPFSFTALNGGTNEGRLVMTVSGGSVSIPAGSSFTIHTASSATGGSIPNPAAMSSAALGLISRNTDIDLDGRSDIIFQDRTSGWTQVWFLGGANGITLLGAANLTVQNSWRAAAVADFDQDGRSDVLWQDPVTGATQIWYLGQGGSGTGLKAAVTLSGGITNPFGGMTRVAATGDFNSDGRPDVVWQNPSTGESQVWLLGGANGATVLGTATLSSGNVWRIAGAGDFNQDGRTDVIWQDPTSGWTQIWLLGGAQGTTIMQAVNLVQANTWRIAAVADLNLDGRLDLVWQDPTSGASQAWFLGGTAGNQIAGAMNISGPNSWAIVGPK